jgi:DNA invertase Pin-like site-specific DNA recombinase
MADLKRAAAYVCVSNDEPTHGWSLDEQEQHIRDYAGCNNYEIVQVYRDETSENSEKRPGYGQMVLDAHAGLFEAIIVLHPSALFRFVALFHRIKLNCVPS